jgi:nicotinamide-nucleotide amidase
MNAEIIAVGSELLLGQIANTNAQYLSKRLADIGVNVFYHTVAGDNEKRLASALQTAMGRSELLLLTGGLGPTKDDLTKETVIKVFQKELVLDEDAMQQIKEYFLRTKKQMTPNNEKQALVVDGSFVLPNEHGMAPGMAFTDKSTTCMLLPGPPSEMKPMFEKYGIPYLQSKSKVHTKFHSRVLKFFGIGESMLETTLQDLIEAQSNPTIAPLASEHEVTIRLTAAHAEENEANKLLDAVESEILKRTSSFFYGYDNETLENQTFNMLAEKELTVASAESLTGGLFGKTLTDFSGSSSVYKGGITAYSNELKQSLLSVPPGLIKTHGAVSKECAEFMAKEIRSLTGAHFGISFTGVAGPQMQEQHEPGTVFIGISSKLETKVFSLRLGGNRKAVRERTVKHGFFLLNQWVRKNCKKTE